MTLDGLVAKLEKPKKLSDGSYMTLCPAHADKNPSLHINEKNGTILLKCQAGCDMKDVVKAMGLHMSDLFADKPKASPKVKPKIIETYNYKDESGNVLFQVCRLEPKSFRQRHKNGKGEWEWNMTGVRRVLYCLPDIIKAPKLYFVEGEKDCDALWERGLVATTSPGGANNWKPEYGECLTGKKVVLIPDNDEAGFAYARDIASALMGKCELSCILLPTKDISDWLQQGAEPTTLAEMEQDITLLWNQDQPQYTLQPDGTIAWKKSPLIFKAEALRHERTGLHGRVSIEHNYSPLAWSVFNLERVEERTRLAKLAHNRLKPAIKEQYPEANLKRDFDLFCAGLWEFYLSHYSPELVYGDEHPKPLRFALRPYILWGGGTIIFAPPGKGKSHTGLLWAQSINSGVKTFWPVEHAPILYINLERSPETTRRRLSAVNRVLGLPATEPLRILNARGRSLLDILPTCRKAIKQHGIRAVVLDSISRAGYGDLTENRPINAIMDALSSLCDTWVALAHTPRADETHIYGGIMFEAAADIVVRLSSETPNPTTLGLGFEITKSNDLAPQGQAVWALEFDENGLTTLRKARPFEFTEVVGKVKKPAIVVIKDYILEQDSADASASEVAGGTGINRGQISSILNHSGQFVKTRKEGATQYFGLKTTSV